MVSFSIIAIIRLKCINIDFSRLLRRTLAVLGSGVRISYAPQAKGHPVGWLFCLWMRGNRALHQHCRAVEGERDRQPPVADALPVSFSNFKERAVRWTVATIKFADRSSNLLCSTFVEVLRYKASTDYGSMGAGLVISTLPTLVLYMCMSSQVQRSLVAGAVKG